MAACLRPRGTLTFIISVASLPACLAAFAAAGCQATTLLPLWPKPQRPAKLVVLQGVKGGRAALSVLPGLVLHSDGGGYTPEAEAILRHGGPLSTQV
jgi:tRNA1(Val) A37 N6-methylase TrmN6